MSRAPIKSLGEFSRIRSMLATIPLPAKVEGGAGLKAEFGDASLRALMSWQIDSDSVVMYNVLLEFEWLLRDTSSF